jgi:hypothetical protein
MAITEPYELDGVSVTTAGISIPSGSSTPSTITDDGVYQVWVDPVTDMVKADELEIRILEKVEGTGGTQRTVFVATLLGVQSELFVTPSLILINGWDVVLDCLAGTSITVDASIRKIA